MCWIVHELNVTEAFAWLSLIPRISWNDEVITIHLEVNVWNLLMLFLSALTGMKGACSLVASVLVLEDVVVDVEEVIIRDEVE